MELVINKNQLPKNFFWVRRQIINSSWSIEIYSEELSKYDVENNIYEGCFHFKKVSPKWPRINGADLVLKRILEEKGGVILESDGDSGFANRNSWLVKLKNNQAKKKVRAPIVIKGCLTKKQLKEVGLYPRLSRETHVVITDDYMIGEVITEEAVMEAERLISSAREEKKIRYNKNFLEYFEKNTQDGIIALFPWGGREKWQVIPEGFTVLGMKVTRFTRDFRQNLTHTYIAVVCREKKLEGKKIQLDIPDELKGILIGKGGKNIKNICKKYGCSIKIK